MRNAIFDIDEEYGNEFIASKTSGYQTNFPKGAKLPWRSEGASLHLLLLILIGAFSLLKYMGWAWVVSGRYGLPSQAHTVAVAQQWSLVNFWLGLVAEVVLIVYLVVHLKLDTIDLEGAPKLLIRGIAALAIACAGTVGVALLLNWAGKLLR